MVYIEEVALDNLIFNAVLLCLAVRVMKEKRVWWRILISATLGAVFAVCMPFIDKALIVYKLAALIAVTAFAVKYKSIKRYILFVLVFAAVSFTTGGAAYGLLYLFTGNGNLYAYTSAHAGAHALKHVVIASFVFIWVLARQLGRFAVRKRISASDGLLAELTVGGESVKVPYFNDSGNRLVDLRTAKPVSVLSHDVGAHYVQEGARTLTVETVNSVSELPIITADKFTIHTRDGVRVYEKMPIAVSDKDFNGYKLILNAEALC